MKEYLRQEYFNHNKIIILNREKLKNITFNVIKEIKNLEKNNWDMKSKNFIFFKPQYLFIDKINHKLDVIKLDSENYLEFMENLNIDIKNRSFSNKEMRKSYIYYSNYKIFSYLGSLNLNLLNKILQYMFIKFKLDLFKLMPELDGEIKIIYKKDFELFNEENRN